MALPASSICSSTPKFQIKMFKNQPHQLNRWPVIHAHPQLFPSRFIKMTTAELGDRNKVKIQLNIAKEMLWAATPDPVKEFPWRKAGDVVLKRLMFIGQTALKWSLVSMFIFSSISDVIFSISRNQELLIPVGLLIGYLMTNYLDEILQEIVQTEDKGFNLPLANISFFFVLVKVISTYFAAGTRVFLLHVANGGLLQVLWLWRHLAKENDKHSENNFNTEGQDASLVADVEE
ncbi:hypothetical protein JCGZ_15976 [Jatropha curcas]|uniref:Uncharacterized protein n=1 Tax=Jatropha curcas TaxID=180498 RepID=A0A067LBT7_JATCU|nr:uncharacterized protein LOC105630796 [Jatropha curcas]KDP41569.1 hypothetical protein JCGZ_15976 [Jatropha curcas]